MIRVRFVTPLDGFRVRIGFTDGSSREVDLESYLHGPIFEPVRSDPAVFAAVRVQDGAIVWPNGADIDPDVLHGNLTPSWMETPASSAIAR